MEFIYGIIIGVIISLLIYWIVPRLFGRDSDRRGVQDGDDSLDGLGRGIESAGKTNKEAKGITELIDGHNQSATNGIRTSKSILEDAKRRQSDT